MYTIYDINIYNIMQISDDYFSSIISEIVENDETSLKINT